MAEWGAVITVIEDLQATPELDGARKGVLKHTVSEDTQSCWHFYFRRQASRTVGKYTSDVSVPIVVDIMMVFEENDYTHPFCILTFSFFPQQMSPGTFSFNENE